MKTREEPQALNFRPDIEGLRGLAVLAVVLFHTGTKYISGGFLGVDVFFVLSGFLITGILLRENNKDNQGLLEFYARRVRRILPASILVVLVVLIFSLFIYRPFGLIGLASAAQAVSGYLVNIYFLYHTVDYFAVGDITHSPLLHMWSLAVEEQFYLFWPTLILVWVRGQHKRLKALVLFSMVFIVSFLCAYRYHGSPPSFFRTDLRAWEFAAGALVALIKKPTPDRIGRIRARASIGGWVGVLILGLCFVFLKGPLGAIAMFCPVGATALILWAGTINPNKGPGLVLGTVLCRGLGRYSYTWYLWHWPFLVLSAPLMDDTNVWFNVLMVLIALLFSVGTYHWFENPIRRSQFLGQRPWLSVGSGILATLALFLLATGVRKISEKEVRERPDMFSRGNIQGRSWRTAYDAVCGKVAKEQTFCEAGDTKSTTKVVLWGDSHAQQWFEVIDELGTKNHWSVLAAIAFGCPPCTGRSQY